MDAKSKELLLRWQSLNEVDALKRVRTRALAFRCAGLVVFAAAAAGIALDWPPVVVAVLAVAFGWIVAETNALRTRIEQWPTFKRYINWQRVTDDLQS